MGDSTVWIRAEFNQSSMTVREEAVLKKNGSVGYYSLKLPSPSVLLSVCQMCCWLYNLDVTFEPFFTFEVHISFAVRTAINKAL